MAGIYIHIPFCATKCAYCDFYSSVDRSLREACMDAILKEIEMRKSYLDGEAIDTIYIGGGTPSQLSAADLSGIFNTIYRHFDISPDPEITLEVNPDDISSAYISSLAHQPVNRISMGIQSFHDDELHLLARRHDSRQARKAIDLCRSLYINISIDLIYGIPGQTLRRWDENLAIIAASALPHISAYHLSYEEGTPLHRLMEKGTISPVDESLSLDMFNLLIDRLSAVGYQHYEISNFARPGYISRHNSSYWQGKKYIGIGPSAHSYDTQSRQWNISSIPQYISGIRSSSPIIEKEPASGYNEYIMTGLRTIWGINLSTLSTQYGEAARLYFLSQAAPYLQSGMLEESAGTIRLTRQAIFISDTVISQLLKVDSYTK